MSRAFGTAPGLAQRDWLVAAGRPECRCGLMWSGNGNLWPPDEFQGVAGRRARRSPATRAASAARRRKSVASRAATFEQAAQSPAPGLHTRPARPDWRCWRPRQLWVVARRRLGRAAGTARGNSSYGALLGWRRSLRIQRPQASRRVRVTAPGSGSSRAAPPGLKRRQRLREAANVERPAAPPPGKASLKPVSSATCRPSVRQLMETGPVRLFLGLHEVLSNGSPPASRSSPGSNRPARG